MTDDLDPERRARLRRRRPRGVHPRRPGRVRPAARPDRDVPPLVRRRARGRGCTSPTPWSSRPCAADFAPSARLVLLKGVSEDGFVFYTNTGSRKGARAGRQPADRAALPVAPARAPGPRRRHGHAAPAGRGRRLLRGPPARLPARRLGLAPVERGLRPRGAAGGVRRGGAALRRRRRCRRPRSGAATSCTRSRWSSGRAGRAGCTTGWSTGAPPTAGAPSGWRPDSGPAPYGPHGPWATRPRRHSLDVRDQAPVPGEPAPAHRRAPVGRRRRRPQVIADVADLQPLNLSPLLAGAIAAEVFILGFLLAGTAGDFKEAERLPGEVAASLETMADECLITYEDIKLPEARTCLAAADRAQRLDPDVADGRTAASTSVMADLRALNEPVPGDGAGDPGRLHHPAEVRAGGDPQDGGPDGHDAAHVVRRRRLPDRRGHRGAPGRHHDPHRPPGPARRRCAWSG